ncbi:hypothetical protein HMPREF3144_06440 [Oligella sp. HMSC05A10]|uniref:hypothetical protein n=1 Tax=Oligella sp. HMSC05A10 TaxID=1581112 RepID=UPI0008A185F6|nr:hypothetical protein [Oligella sp. HMSC05A10]OFS84479.1 hypothetical protein HMPREF3144_06440 [Oligella sp. HMSC05A10]
MKNLPADLVAMLSAEDKRYGRPDGTLLSVMQQEIGGQMSKYLSDPTAYHYQPNAQGKRIAPHTGKVSTAFGPFGILESTARDPGYGVKPLQNKSLPEQIRFASDYLQARSRQAGSLKGGLAGYGEGAKYANQVASRVGGQQAKPNVIERVANAVFPAAHAAETGGDDLDLTKLSDEELLAALYDTYEDEEEEGPSDTTDLSKLSDEELMAMLKAEGLAESQEQPTTQRHSRLGEFGRQVGRQVGLTGRYALQGLSALPEMMINPFIQAAGGKPLKMSDALDTVGYVKPESASERISEDVVGLMASTGGLAGLAGKASNMTSGATKGVMGLLSANPGQQIAGAIGSGLAGGTAREMGFGPVGQTVAALGGGLLASSATHQISKPPRQKIRNDATEALKERASRLYKLADERGITAQPSDTKNLQQEIRGLLSDNGIITSKGVLDTSYGKASGAVKLIDDFAGESMTVKQMQTVRRRLQDAAGSIDPPEKRIGTMMLAKFDDFVAPFAPELSEARSIYRRHMKASELEQLRELAANKAQSNYVQSGMDNALRKQYRGLLDNIVKNKPSARGWSKEEQDAIRRVVDGTVTINAARRVGKLAPKGVVSLIGGAGVPYMIGNSIGGPQMGTIAMAGSSGLGILGANAADFLTLRNAQLAEAIARGDYLRALPNTPYNPMGAIWGASLLDHEQ